MELLISTVNKIISYQFLVILLEGANHEQSSQINQSVWCSPQKYGRGFFQKKFFMWDKRFWEKKLWDGRTNDQIMPR